MVKWNWKIQYPGEETRADLQVRDKRWDGSCTGFAWQGFGGGGAAGVATVRSCQKLPLCLTKPVPAGSKMGRAHQ